MKLINPSFKIIQQEVPTVKLDKDRYVLHGELIMTAKKQIELAGRVCYKSEDKITENSYKKFFEMLKNKNHLSVFEHGTIYLKIVVGSPMYDDHYLKKADIVQIFKKNPYSKVVERRQELAYEGVSLDDIPAYYITTNYRVIEEMFTGGGIFKTKPSDVFEYLSLPTEYHKKRISVKFTCSRAIAQELTRHRVFSFSMESQRYCNYSKGKFGNEITFIQPEYSVNNPRFEKALQDSEESYFYLLSTGQTPQEAREVLPNATKTELFMTGYVDDWNEFFKLRISDAAHPEMRRLIIPLQKEFENVQ